MRISLIVAMGKSRQIGFENRIPWHISEDLKLFKKITLGHHLLMGRNTFESIGKPLPGRTTYILSRNKNLKIPGCQTVDKLENAFSMAEQDGEDEFFVCGGVAPYTLALPMAHRIYLSRIIYDGPADAYFPSFNQDEWKVLEKETYPIAGGQSFDFCILERF